MKSNSYTPIILVYVSRKLPKYVIDSAISCGKRFPERKTILLTNASTPKKVNEVNLEIVKLHSQSKMPNLNELGLDHNVDFRSGFWYRTIERFFILESFMQEQGIDKSLHIEADVWLSEDFPFEKLDEKVLGLAYPPVDKSRSSGAVFFVGRRDALRSMLDFFYIAVNQNPKLTDMVLLKEFSDARPSMYQPLPTEFSTRDSNPLSSDELGGIFDAAPWGQYLFGLDPSINFGKTNLFKDLSGYGITPSSTILSVDSHHRLRISQNGAEFSLFNLHIHSKNRKLFTLRGELLFTFLRRTLGQSKGGTKKSFSMFGFIKWSKIMFIVAYRKQRKKLFKNPSK